MTKEDKICFCEGFSDKDFIFNVFSDKGFVDNANGFLNTNSSSVSGGENVNKERTTQFDCDECAVD
ncbi:hypothetical protein [Carboxylicivirga sp. N1Y90]|uniref:hypothetical protein n=1 Tax=Carboxylicivirga fragile TaxID=3417571 RepID=UPI003D34BF8F|nr:hypothetical protein [Marinilabiliaceae bacterium N1Y90]